MPTCLQKYAEEYDDIFQHSIITSCLTFIVSLAAVSGIVIGSIELSYSNRMTSLGLGLLIPGGATLLLIVFGWSIRRMIKVEPIQKGDIENQIAPVKPVLLLLDEEGMQMNPMHSGDSPLHSSAKQSKSPKKHRKRSNSDPPKSSLRPDRSIQIVQSQATQNATQ